jgi:hypothetical protein
MSQFINFYDECHYAESRGATLVNYVRKKFLLHRHLDEILWIASTPFVAREKFLAEFSLLRSTRDLL